MAVPSSSAIQQSITEAGRMTTDNLPDKHAIAAQLLQAQDHARQITPITSQAPGFDVAAAYEVAELIHQQRLAQGAIAAGRKIGFTNAAMWAKYGVQEPVWGHTTAPSFMSPDRKGHAVSLDWPNRRSNPRSPCTFTMRLPRTRTSPR